MGIRPKSEHGILHAVKRVRGGVPVEHQKIHTASMKPARIPVPKTVALPMQQHIGVPCTPQVRVGDSVCVGQVVGDSEAYISAPVHASVSGKVIAIGEVTLPNGTRTQGVTIASDGEMRLLESLAPPRVETRADFLAAARASGLIGLGGAGFPTHVKLNIPPEKNVDTLIVNAAECEPFITVDYRECMDNTRNILLGVNLIRRFLQLKRVIICVEDNKPEAIAQLKRSNSDLDSGNEQPIQIMTLRSIYPQGAEKMMVQSATGKKVPPGKLPADMGCIVLNVASVAFLARYTETGKPLVSRTLTVDGSAITQPKNVRAPIGTDIGEVIRFCGGFSAPPAKLVAGGPMMGLALVGTDFPTLKQNNAILAFAKDAPREKKERDCIRCGRCVAACPMSLMPTLIKRFSLANDAARLERIGVQVCMECGSCAYACPSGLPLLQYMRLAKTVHKEGNIS